MVPLCKEFNQNKETEASRNKRIPKTNGQSMKHRNTYDEIISTFVKLSLMLMSVTHQIERCGGISISIGVTWPNVHYVTFAVVWTRSLNINACDVELNGLKHMENWTLDWLKRIDKEKNCHMSNALNTVAASRAQIILGVKYCTQTFEMPLLNFCTWGF